MSMKYSSKESESEHEELESDKGVVSLIMDRLRTPMPADIARSRKVDPPKDKRRCKGRPSVISTTAVYKTMSKHL